MSKDNNNTMVISAILLFNICWIITIGYVVVHFIHKYW